MKKFCSSFLVVERIYWTFGLNFLTVFSKLQPTCAAEGFEVFLGEKSDCLIVFGLWAKITVFWQKIYGRLLKVNFTCPQQDFETKMNEVYFPIIVFLGPWMSFFLILTKKSNQVCRNSNLNVQKKNLNQKRYWTLDLALFLEFDKNKLIFLTESFLQGCQTYFLHVQRNTYRATFPKGSLENLRIFL